MRSQSRQAANNAQECFKIHDTNSVYYLQTKNTSRILKSNKENVYNTNNVFKKKSSAELTPNKITASDYNI